MKLTGSVQGAVEELFQPWWGHCIGIRPAMEGQSRTKNKTKEPEKGRIKFLREFKPCSRPVAPVNVPAEKFVESGHGRGRGTGRAMGIGLRKGGAY
uniref:'chromo' domain containing protein n=1 Tax=Solanum tuberosum TaxID=4113 RepID=M1DLD4_SOLTU